MYRQIMASFFLAQPQPSTSSTPDDMSSGFESDLSLLCKACPNLEQLELINTGFSQSIALTGNKPLTYQPW